MLILFWTDKATSQENYVRFDVTTQQTIESIMQITSHPVEEGANVADHARPDNPRLSIEAYVSNKPLFSNPGVLENNLLTAQSIALAPYMATLARTRPDRRKLDLPKPPLQPNAAAVVGAAVSAIGDAITGKSDTTATLAKQQPQDKSARASVYAGSSDFPDRARAMWEKLYNAQQDRVLIRVSFRLAELENMMIAKLSSPRTPEDGSGASFQLELERVRIVSSMTVATPLASENRGAKEKSTGSKGTEKAENEEKKVQAVADSILYGIAQGAAQSVGLGFLKLP